ncbi:MAG: helix-turn-helix domain-containing protein [Lysobacteraceae bacterium]|nr:MAG: helix-turn-helix domain-containing protein [Xanthomonadaceae bacterium]
MNDQIQSDLQVAGEHASGCGAVLRAARESSGLSLAEVASRLKMQTRVLQALEDDDWQRLGAPVFVRGQLRSYARLLKVDVEPFLEQFRLEPVRPADLVSHSHTPRYQRMMESLARRAVYVVITGAIAIPVWVATQSHIGDNAGGTTASLDMMPVAAPAAQADGMQPRPASEARATPYVASLTPPLPRVGANALTLRMVGDSWVQVIAPDGSSIEQGLFKAGEQRNFRQGQVGRVVLGNAAAVEVQQSGSTVDMTPYKRANVARFAVSSDGSLVPVAE